MFTLDVNVLILKKMGLFLNQGIKAFCLANCDWHFVKNKRVTCIVFPVR